MSRTYKTTKIDFRNPESLGGFDRDFSKFPYLQIAGKKMKKKKHVDTEYHWMATPSWWTRMFMNKPQRHASRMWEHEIVKVANTAGHKYDVEDAIEDLEPPIIGNKPHIYYW